MRRRTPPRRSPKTQPAGPAQTFQVDALTHEAKGVARLNGKVTFIEGALPGETVEAKVIKVGRRFDEASLVSIQSPSEHRITPVCAHFEQCGGCSFQHLSYDKQLDAKRSWLAGQLRNVASGLDIELLTDQATQYRRRARISVQFVKGQLLMGFRGKASNQIVSIDRCEVLTASLQDVFAKLKERLDSERSVAQKLGHIELLEDDKGVSVLLRLIAELTGAEKLSWLDWASKEAFELYLQAPNENKVRLEDQRIRHYQLDGLSLQFHPQDFIQVNAAMNKKMVEQAMSWMDLNEDDVVLDLFCGVGNFSLPLAKRAKQVLGIEVQDGMVQAGRDNAQLNALDNVAFLAADLTKPISTDLAKMGVTNILLDPPRAGALEFLDSILQVKPAQILYVSCNASTLARDAEYLVAKGYQVVRVSLMDMFPQTSHVETMMLLQKRSKTKGK